jgi:hypothetical protein
MGFRESAWSPYVCEYAEVPESLLQDLHDLEVGYVVFIVNACTGA